MLRGFSRSTGSFSILMATLEQHLIAREARRLAAEHRSLGRQEQLEKKAEPLVGELCREGRTLYYCWPVGGKYFESASFFAVVAYLVRNRWVTLH